MSESQDFLIIGSVWPEPDSSAAGIRMMQLIKLFQSDGWNITFASSSSESSYAVDLSSHGITPVPVKMNSVTFDNFIRHLQPTAVMFDRFVTEEQFGWRVAEQCPRAMRILDTEDLHCLRRARKKALNEGREFNSKDLLREDSAKREIAAILRSDLSLIISDYEMSLLHNLFEIDEALFHYLPFMVDSIDEVRMSNWPTFKNRSHFITVGNFRHAPNWDAIQYLKNDIWPLIRNKLPETELHIYGAYPSEKARALHQPKEGFLIKGRADDAKRKVQQARICLAPLRFGAGLKGKLIEAMQCGTPSITTPVGAEGIAGEMDWSGFVAQSSGELAEVAVRLYSDRLKWERAQAQGINIINQRFARKKFENDFLDRIHKIQRQLDNHRLDNFRGAMLRHHTAASTKYMARWIEAKNKLKMGS